MIVALYAEDFLALTGIARDILGTDDPSGMEAAIARDPAAALQFRTALIQAEADARRLCVR